MQTEFLEQLKTFDSIPNCGYILGRDKHNREVFTLYKTHVISNGHTYKLNEPEYLKAWYDGDPTTEEIKHVVMLNDWSRWNQSLIKDSEPVEVSEAVYYDMLNCLPPRNWNGDYFEVGEPHHHDSNGKPIHRAFYKEGDKFFTSYPKQ